MCSELLFMGSWHPLAPDILTMAEEHAGVETGERAAISAPMDPKVPIFCATPLLLLWWPRAPGFL